MSIVDIAGLIIDEETGEIIDSPPGEDRLTLAATRLYEANQQVKEWEKIAGYYKSVLLREQVEKTTVYGDVIASIRQAVREVLDVKTFRVELSLRHLSPETLWTIIEAATAFNLTLLPDSVSADQYITHVPSKPYVVVDLVKKAAPKVRQVK